MKDLNTSTLLKIDLALKNTITKVDSVAGAQAVWRRRLRVRWGARDRARAGVLPHGRLRGALLPATTVGVRGLMREGIAPLRESARALRLALVRGQPTAALAVLLLVVVPGPGSAPEP